MQGDSTLPVPGRGSRSSGTGCFLPVLPPLPPGQLCLVSGRAWAQEACLLQEGASGTLPCELAGYSAPSVWLPSTIILEGELRRLQIFKKQVNNQISRERDTENSRMLCKPMLSILGFYTEKGFSEVLSHEVPVVGWVMRVCL